MYGAVGVVAIALLFSLPIVRAAYFSMPGAAPGLSSLLTALAALVLMSALDSLLNGAFLLPYLLVVGGLSADIHPDQDCHGANAPALRRRRYTVGTSQG
jgi:hypothetical protein